MPSTAGSAAGVGVGALINSAGSSASMDIGAGTGAGVAIGGGSTAANAGSSAVAAASAGTLIAQSTAGTSAASGTITWDNNGTLRSINPGDWSIEQCLIWQQPHHLYFQLGWAFLFLAFLAPHGPFGSLWMRATMLIGCIMMGMYGYLIECTPDVVLWSGLGIGINFIYLIVVLCRLRPVRFDQEIEAMYVALFQPLHVTRQQFRKVLNCMKVIRGLKYQEVYAQEKVTKVDSLSLVLSGKLVVSQHQRALHIVFPHQFLDSPEWFGVSTDDYFQVSIMAMEESRVLIWHRDKLKLSIMAEPFLQTVFDHILGRDVVKKLMQVSESIASNGFLPSGGYAEDAEDKPMLILKKSVDVGHGLTALINRQLQEEHVPLLGRTYKHTKQQLPPTPPDGASLADTSVDHYAIAAAAAARHDGSKQSN
ncbi:PREDICTED: blood vessel epicardial substance isoform X2 [Drosophila arizonae]|uniref:Blood vessel epicardial substance isoform X2 n=1 Tax=Drosophila arizonae TaxID=7263 RepID=A0ABM1PPS1_DROAR|nr:PREDICTED: blood vessel epicardial substance isoform X2 [Drosophila arizonae]